MKIVSYVLFCLCIWLLVAALPSMLAPTSSSRIPDAVNSNEENTHTANNSHTGQNTTGSITNGSTSVSSKLPVAIQEENQRHQQKLAELEADYRTDIRKCETDIYNQKVGCTISEAECNAKIAELRQKIAEIESKISHSGSSIGNSSHSAANNVNLVLSIQSLSNQITKYNDILRKYATIRSLERKKLDIENDYTDAVLAECEFHEQELKRLNQK